MVKPLIEAILHENSDLSFIFGDDKEICLSVHQNTIFGTLSNALYLTFPKSMAILQKKSSGEVFDLHRFISDVQSMPKGGCLDDWGEGFIEYLKVEVSSQEESSSLSALPYLPDLAKFEWLSHLCTLYSPKSGIQLEDLSLYSEEDLHCARCSLSDGYQFWQGSFDISPVVEGKDDGCPKLPSYALITTGQGVKLNVYYLEPWLGKVFKGLLIDNMTLGEVLEQFVPDTQIQACFEFLFKKMPCLLIE